MWKIDIKNFEAGSGTVEEDRVIPILLLNYPDFPVTDIDFKMPKHDLSHDGVEVTLTNLSPVLVEEVEPEVEEKPVAKTRKVTLDPDS